MKPSRTDASGTASSNSFEYTGRENDSTGLYFYRARYYNPGLQRFVSEDPIGLAGGINQYGYVEGNPISRIDPEGLSWRQNLGEIAVCIACLLGGNRVPPQTSQPPRPVPILPALGGKPPKCE